MKSLKYVLLLSVLVCLNSVGLHALQPLYVEMQVKAVGRCREAFNEDGLQKQVFSEGKRCSFRLVLPLNVAEPNQDILGTSYLAIHSGKSKKNLNIINENATDVGSLLSFVDPGVKITLFIKANKYYKINGNFVINPSDDIYNILFPTSQKCSRLENKFKSKLIDAQSCTEHTDCADSGTFQAVNLYGTSCNCDDRIPLNRSADDAKLDALLLNGLNNNCDFAINFVKPDVASICLCNPQYTACIQNRCTKVSGDDVIVLN